MIVIMIWLRSFFALTVFIYGCASMAIIEPLKSSTQPVSSPGPLVVNCSARLLRSKTNPLVADASRFYLSSKAGSISPSGGGKAFPESEHGDSRGNVQISERDRLLNCSDPEISIEPVREHNEWKNVVVMGCTLAVALEILIVLFMVVFWQQIRWTLRKITCPCDLLRRQSRRHRAMRRRDETGEAVNQETNMDDVVSLDSRSSLDEDGQQRGEASGWGTEMQIYEPTTSGAFNGSFIHRSEDDNSSQEDEQRTPLEDRRRHNHDKGQNPVNKGGESTRGCYSVIDSRNVRNYYDAECFAQPSYRSDAYDTAEGGETSGGGLYETDDCDNSYSFVNNFGAEGGSSSSGGCLENTDENGPVKIHGGSKKGKESARSYRKGLQRPNSSDTKVCSTDENTSI